MVEWSGDVKMNFVFSFRNFSSFSLFHLGGKRDFLEMKNEEIGYKNLEKSERRIF